MESLTLKYELKEEDFWSTFKQGSLEKDKKSVVFFD